MPMHHRRIGEFVCKINEIEKNVIRIDVNHSQNKSYKQSMNREENKENRQTHRRSHTLKVGESNIATMNINKSARFRDRIT